MDAPSDILIGFQTALTATNILYCFLGVLLGTIVGLLPGLGSATGIALLLPLTLDLEPATALIMLAGIFYGSQYGGTISAVLVATPGEATNVVTAVDGYQMARRGRAGPALAISAIGSFVAGTITAVLLMTLAPTVSQIALRLGPVETFAILVLGLVGVSSFGENRAKGLAMAALGLAVTAVGIDAQTGTARFTFGSTELLGGVEFLAVVIGVFAVAEVIRQVGHGAPEPIRTRFRDMLLTRDDVRRSRGPILRGSFLGFFIGTMPGAAILSSFLSYDVENRLRRRKPRPGPKFGEGAIEAVAGPESANNAAASGTFVPLLTLGIPASSSTAVLLGALLLFGLQPGPLLLEEQPEVAWGLIASLYIGNVILLVLNLPLAPAFASLLRIRYSYLYPFILLVSFIGAFAAENRMWGVWVTLAFGLIGYALSRADFPMAPLVLGLVLGGLLERSLSQSLAIGGGDPGVFLEKPIALGILGLAALILIGPAIVKRLRPSRTRAVMVDPESAMAVSSARPGEIPAPGDPSLEGTGPSPSATGSRRQDGGEDRP